MSRPTGRLAFCGAIGHNQDCVYVQSTTMALKLTARQSQILDLIRQSIATDGRPPTRAEIADALGFRSANAAEDHLRALARKGMIRLTAGTSRGIQLVEAHGTPAPAGWGGIPGGMAGIPGGTAATPGGMAGVPGGMAATPAGMAEAPAGMAGTSKGMAVAAGDPGGTAGGPSLRLVQAADHLLLPVVGRVAAGHPILAAEHVEREIPVGAGLFAQTPDYLLRVRGASMRDAGILDGDLLAVRRSSEARNGQIVVARLGDDVTVKRLERRDGRLRLLPENPDFQPILVGPGDDFALEGIAVGLIRTDALH